MHTSQQHSNSLLNQMRALRNRFLVITPSTPDSAWACRQAANAQQVVSRRWRQEGGGGGSKLGRHAPALPPTIATELTGLGAAHTAGNKRGCRENPLACPASSGQRPIGLASNTPGHRRSSRPRAHGSRARCSAAAAWQAAPADPGPPWCWMSGEREGNAGKRRRGSPAAVAAAAGPLCRRQHVGSGLRRSLHHLCMLATCELPAAASGQWCYPPARALLQEDVRLPHLAAAASVLLTASSWLAD